MGYRSFMDGFSPPPSADQTSGSKQPTYTTAGTIYKPSSSHPLQAPTRRGRSKWPHGSLPSDLAPLLQVKVAAPTIEPPKGPGGRVPVYHQPYTPLQQNLDRAISPTAEPDDRPANMTDQALQMRSGNMPSALSSLTEGSHEDKSVDGDNSDESDSDSDFGAHVLKGMTVNSLHNLASYDNPNQKKAQKALCRGVKPDVNGWSRLPRGHPSSSNNGIRPIGSPLKEATESRDMPRPAQPDFMSVRRLVRDVPAGSKLGLDKRASGYTRGREPATNMDNIGEALNYAMMVKPRSGAPQPLTAGPPGQRQYHPSTFRSTLMAFNAKKQGERASDDDGTDHGFVKPRARLVPFLRHGHGSEPGKCYLLAAKDCSPPQLMRSTIKALTRSDEEILDIRAPRSLPSDRRSHGYSSPSVETVGSAAHYVPLEPLTVPPSWRDPSSEKRRHIKPGTDLLTDEEIQARNKRTDQYWYSGSDLIGKTMTEGFLDARYRLLERNPKLGVIGDKRAAKEKVECKPIKIEQANHMSVADHAEPLINMAYATLLRYIEDAENTAKDFGDGPV